MYFDFIKNPIVLGVLAGALTYLYLWWTNKPKDKKGVPDAKNISLITPLIVAVVVYVIAYAYLGGIEPSASTSTTTTTTTSLIPEHYIFKQDPMPQVPQVPQIPQIPQVPQMPQPTGQMPHYQFAKDVTESPASFHLISKGVNIPNNLQVPDVFIETY